MIREQDEEEEDEKSVKEEKDGSEGSLEWPKKAKTEPHPVCGYGNVNRVETALCFLLLQKPLSRPIILVLRSLQQAFRFLPQNALEGFVPFGTHVQVRIQVVDMKIKVHSKQLHGTVKQSPPKKNSSHAIQGVKNEWCIILHLLGVAALDAASKLLQNLSYESRLPHLAISNHVSPGAWMLFYYQKMDAEQKRKRKSIEDDVSCIRNGVSFTVSACTLLHDAGIPTQSDATHVVDRFIGTHPIDMRVNEDLCFTSAIDKNGARPPSVNCADTQNAAGCFFRLSAEHLRLMNL
ncbi:hypothetical protein Tco_1175782 [Tanacetum coccineum]